MFKRRSMNRQKYRTIIFATRFNTSTNETFNSMILISNTPPECARTERREREKKKQHGTFFIQEFVQQNTDSQNTNKKQHV